MKHHNVTIALTEDLYQSMRNHREINWSEVCRQAIADYITETFGL